MATVLMGVALTVLGKIVKALKIPEGAYVWICLSPRMLSANAGHKPTSHEILIRVFLFSICEICIF